MKKTGLTLIFISLLVILMASCSNDDSTSSSKGEKKDIEYWGPFSGPDGPFMKEIVDEYNNSQEEYNVNFKIVPNDDYYKNVDLAFNSKDLPDVFIMHTNQMSKYIEEDLLKNLNDDIGEKIKKSDYDESAIEQVEYDGDVYAVPLAIFPSVMYWNKDMFEEAGLDPNKPPHANEEFIDYAQKLTDVENGQYGFVVPTVWPQEFTFPSIVYQNGGSLINEDGKANYSSNEVVESVQFLHDLIYKHEVSPENVELNGENTLFLQGKNAMYIDGPWKMNQVKESGLNYGVAPIPQLGTKTEAVYADGHNFAIPKGTDEEKTEGVIDFLSYVAENGMAWAESGQAPVAKATFESEEFKSLEDHQAIVEEFDYAKFPPQISNWDELTTPFWEALNDVLLDNIETEEALKKAEEEANK